MGFYAYKLDEASREGLLGSFPPAYPSVFADHITYKTAAAGESMPELDKMEIIGFADDGRGLQTAIVRINDAVERPDGKIFHITWSLDPSKEAPAAFDVMAKPGKEKPKPYRPVHSNGLLAHTMEPDGSLKTPSNPEWKITMLDVPQLLSADAVYMGDDKSVTPVRLHSNATKSVKPGTVSHSVTPEGQQHTL